MKNGDSKIVEFGDGSGSEKLAKKSRKLSKGLKLPKSGNSKGKNLAQSKKLLKSGNLPNFDVKKAGPSFLTLKARAAFNRLQLAFTKALILWHFDPKYHIWIETDVSGYAIGRMLSQLAFETRPDGVVIKTNLGQ